VIEEQMTFGMAGVVVAIVGMAACVWDLRTQRIPNALTLSAAVAAIVFHAATAGWSGAGFSVSGWLVGTLIFFPFFVVRGMGAGDVKLLAAFGAWLGPRDVLYAAAATAVIGALFALAVIIARHRTQKTFTHMSAMISSWTVEGVRALPGLTLAEPSRLALCYSLPITAGALVTIWFG
jgi:prepilin peptidase CpaA